MKTPPLKLEYKGLELLNQLEGQFIQEVYVTEELLYFKNKNEASRSIIKLSFVSEKIISICIYCYLLTLPHNTVNSVLTVYSWQGISMKI
jgi:hypothetical protein